MLPKLYLKMLFIADKIILLLCTLLSECIISVWGVRLLQVMDYNPGKKTCFWVMKKLDSIHNDILIPLLKENTIHLFFLPSPRWRVGKQSRQYNFERIKFDSFFYIITDYRCTGVPHTDTLRTHLLHPNIGRIEVQTSLPVRRNNGGVWGRLPRQQ